MSRKNNGTFLILHINKRIWGFLSLPTREWFESKQDNPINKRKKSFSKLTLKEMLSDLQGMKLVLGSIIF